MGLIKSNKEDYGQTLGKWGVGEGCYLVLPVLGPSTVKRQHWYHQAFWVVIHGIM